MNMDNRNQWGNGWPMGRKKTARLLIALTILAWATQLLLQQWGFAQAVANGVPQDTSADSNPPAVYTAPVFDPQAAPASDATPVANPLPAPVEPQENFISSREMSPNIELR